MRFRDRLYQFMQGRYGPDQFTYFLMGTYVVLTLLSMFLRFPVVYAVLNVLSYAAAIYMLFRMFSRNIYKRQAENQMFLHFWAPFGRFFSLQKRRVKEGKTSRFYCCPKCRQIIRVPKGKGKIQITCPKCRNSFIKKT